MQSLLFLSCPFHALIIYFEEWYLHLCCMIIACQYRISLLHHFVSFIFLQKVIASSPGGVKKNITPFGGQTLLIDVAFSFCFNSFPLMSIHVFSIAFMSFPFMSFDFLVMSFFLSCHFKWKDSPSFARPPIEKAF